MISMAKKSATLFSCTDCGAQSPKWLGRCPDCNAWNSFAEESKEELLRPNTALTATAGPVPLDSIDLDQTPRINIDLGQLDRVLGGGLVPGAVILVGGEPGIGKSTLLLQVAKKLSELGNVLYVSGEESPRQIAMRARRLGAVDPAIHLFAETSVERIVRETEAMRPAAVIVDSIQTVYTTTNPSAPGSIAQVRDCAGILMTLAKRLAVPLFLIGHITKEGTIAGPKTLEHIVDTVLYFEGDKFQNGRLLRAYKNRFGPVNEIALLQMHDNGLEEIPNPSAALLAQRSESPGSAVVAAVEGTRPILIELQALVAPTHYSTPKRTAIGFDANRLAIILAVLEKRGGIQLSAHDVYLNIAGGLSIDEPAIDLGAVAAIAASHRNIRLPWDLAIFGELGLLGEIRGVSQPDLRAREAAALGFRRIIVPQQNAEEIHADIEVIAARKLENVLEALRPLKA
jgi:DNA repair protein RadA/Sms